MVQYFLKELSKHRVNYEFSGVKSSVWSLLDVKVLMYNLLPHKI